MRVAVTGATGNLGTSVLRALREQADIEEIVGIARRRPSTQTRQGALGQRRCRIRRIGCGVRRHGCRYSPFLVDPTLPEPVGNVVNKCRRSSRVFQAAASAGVGALIYASTVGAYSPGPKDRPIAESWPTDGVPTCIYSREKAYVERILDTFETRHPKIRVVRLRPGFVFKRAAASGIRRLFAGPFVPTPLLHPRFLPLVPRLPELLFQAVHSHDVGQAFQLRRAALAAQALGG